MKSILSIVALLFSSVVFGQSADSTGWKSVKVGVVFAPEYCYRLLNYHPSNGWVEDLRNNEEEATFGFTTGLGFKMNLSSKFVFESGLFYSIKGEQIKSKDLEWASPNPDFPVNSKAKYHFKYIELPLKAQYLIGSGRLKGFVSAGVAVNIFSEKETKIISASADGHSTSEPSVVDLGYLKFNVAAVLGVGMTYDLTRRFSISVEPVYKRFLNSIVVDDQAKEYPYSFGANFGVYYAIK